MASTGELQMASEIEYHFYKTKGPNHVPTYDTFTFGTNLAGYLNKVPEEIAAENHMRYLGYGKESKVYCSSYHGGEKTMRHQ